MSKLGKFCIGLSAFFIMSGGLLALSGWVTGAETRLTYQRDGYTMEYSPFNIWFYGDSNGHWADETHYEYKYDNYDYKTDYAEIGGWDGAYAPTNVPAFVVPVEYQDRLTINRSEDPFQSIDIDIGMGEIVFQQADSYAVEVSYYGKDYAVPMENNDGALRVWSENSNFFGGRMGDHWGGRVTISIPKDAYLEQVILDADMGDVYVGGFRTEYLSVEASMGSAALTGLSSEQTELELDMGSLEVEGSEFTEMLTVKCSMGSIVIDNSTLECGVDLNADMGEITVSTATPESRYYLDLRANMGTIVRNGAVWAEETLESGNGDYEFSANCSMGSVNVTFGA